MGCYIWYSEEGPGRRRSPPRPLLDRCSLPNVTAHPSTASVPTSFYLMWQWHYNYQCPLKGQLRLFVNARIRRGQCADSHRSCREHIFNRITRTCYETLQLTTSKPVRVDDVSHLINHCTQYVERHGAEDSAQDSSPRLLGLSHCHCHAELTSSTVLRPLHFHTTYSL